MSRKSRVKEVTKGEAFVAYNPKDIKNTQKGPVSTANPKKQSEWPSVKSKQIGKNNIDTLVEKLTEELIKQRRTITIRKS